MENGMIFVFLHGERSDIVHFVQFCCVNGVLDCFFKRATDFFEVIRDSMIHVWQEFGLAIARENGRRHR
jgi:hypothetical protein